METPFCTIEFGISAISNVLKTSSNVTDYVKKVEELIVKDRINARTLGLKKAIWRETLTNSDIRNALREPEPVPELDNILTTNTNFDITEYSRKIYSVLDDEPIQVAKNQIMESEILADMCILNTAFPLDYEFRDHVFSGWVRHARFAEFRNICYENGELDQLSFAGKKASFEHFLNNEFDSPQFPTAERCFFDYIDELSERHKGSPEKFCLADSKPPAHCYGQNKLVRKLITKIMLSPVDCVHLLTRFRTPMNVDGCFIEDDQKQEFCPEKSRRIREMVETLNRDTGLLRTNKLFCDRVLKGITDGNTQSLLKPNFVRYYLQVDSVDCFKIVIGPRDIRQKEKLELPYSRVKSTNDHAIQARKLLDPLYTIQAIIDYKYKNGRSIETFRSKLGWKINCSAIIQAHPRLRISAFDLAEASFNCTSFHLMFRDVTKNESCTFENTLVNTFAETIEQNPSTPFRSRMVNIRSVMKSLYRELGSKDLTCLITDYAYPQSILHRRVKMFYSAWKRLRLFSSIPKIRNADNIAIYLSKDETWIARSFTYATSPDPFAGKFDPMNGKRILYGASLNASTPFTAAFEIIREYLFDYVPALNPVFGGGILLLEKDNIKLVSRNVNGYYFDFNSNFFQFDFCSGMHTQYAVGDWDFKRKTVRKFKTNWNDCEYKELYLEPPNAGRVATEICERKTIDGKLSLNRGFIQYSFMPSIYSYVQRSGMIRMSYRIPSTNKLVKTQMLRIFCTSLDPLTSLECVAQNRDLDLSGVVPKRYLKIKLNDAHQQKYDQDEILYLRRSIETVLEGRFGKTVRTAVHCPDRKRQ